MKNNKIYKKVIDLSHDIVSDMMVFPGDPKVQICQACSILEHGLAVSSLSLGSHSGTHIDAPSHFLADQYSLSDFGVGDFVARGVVINCSHKKALEAITLDDIKSYLKDFQQGDFALFYTGFGKYFGSEYYFKHPYLDIETVNTLLDLGVRAFLMDTLSPDQFGDENFPVHYAILEQNAIIGENFTNLDEINFTKPLISILPMKLKDGDGAPIRAVAIDLN